MTEFLQSYLILFRVNSTFKCNNGISFRSRERDVYRMILLTRYSRSSGAQCFRHCTGYQAYVSLRWSEEKFLEEINYIFPLLFAIFSRHFSVARAFVSPIR